MRRQLVFIASLPFVLYTSVVLAAPDGWSVLVENGEEIFIPGDLASEEEYRLFVALAETLPQSEYPQWFKKRIDLDAGKWGEVLAAPEPRQNNGGVMTATYALQRQDGVPRYAHYMGFYGQGKAVYLRILSSDVTTLVSRYASGMQRVIKETMPERLKGVAISQAVSNTPVETTTSEATPVAPPAKITTKAAPPELKRIDNAAAPEYSLPDKYEALVCDFTENRIDDTYDDYVILLFKDGAAYKGLTVPPEDLDVAKSREEYPNRWGVWEEEDEESYKVKIPASEKEWSSLYKGRHLAPARMGERLNRYISKTTMVNMGMIGGGSSYTNSWTFLGAGRFSKGYSSLFSSGMMSSMTAGTSVYAASYSDDTGDSSIVSGNSPGVGVTSQKKRNDGSNNRGRYRLNGYAMELTYDNGETDRKLFGFCYDDRTQPFLGGTLFPMRKSGPAEKLPYEWGTRISLNEERYYVPKELKEGEIFRVVFSPMVELEGAVIEDWFKEAVSQNFAYLGKPIMEGEWGNDRDTIYSYYNAYNDADGAPLVVFYYGAKVEDKYGRFMRIITSDLKLNKRFKEEMKPAMLRAFMP
ncbi:hypothetical protein O5O45_24730 [Hahella aquimaris]|uniref:hypothetical protein n=1 Tax=Hahella sp. HNIBRBA332 TaxID=3015983 RepID=UPI00273CA9DA|nr:hypothetical protein [Hahella sp. HNIBRBA332]WLQ12937.1 hypothetical protein O5O45_24730 [Hahella sp. HNIBRBA332]